jgi:hypothetical protein
MQVITTDEERTIELKAGDCELEIRPQAEVVRQPACGMAVLLSSDSVLITSFVAAAHRIIILPWGLILDFEPIVGAFCRVQDGRLVSAYRVTEVQAGALAA